MMPSSQSSFRFSKKNTHDLTSVSMLAGNQMRASFRLRDECQPDNHTVPCFSWCECLSSSSVARSSLRARAGCACEVRVRGVGAGRGCGLWVGGAFATAPRWGCGGGSGMSCTCIFVANPGAGCMIPLTRGFYRSDVKGGLLSLTYLYTPAVPSSCFPSHAVELLPITQSSCFPSHAVDLLPITRSP